MSIKIGFIGLGAMGLPLARLLTKAGHRVTGYDIEPTRMEQAESHNIQHAKSPRGAAQGCAVVFTCLPKPEHLDAVCRGPDGILPTLQPNVVLVDLSTVDPNTIRRLGTDIRNRGADMIDAPITRSVEMAWAGKVALLIGGEPKTFERLQPLLSVFSELQSYCGPLGNGSAMKLVNNFLQASFLCGISEALSVGINAGLTLETIMAACQRSGTSNKMLLEVLPKTGLKGEFKAGFRSTLALKDQRLFAQLAKEVESDLAIAPIVEKRLEELVDFDPDLDISALLKMQETRDKFAARISNWEKISE